MMDFKNLLAERTSVMGASAIREILKVVSQPGMVSLAGGIPAPQSFPMSIISELTEKVISKYASGAFQYDLTEGFMPLQEQLSILLAERGIKAEPDEINISSGSQGVLDGMAKILISKGDKIALRDKGYFGVPLKCQGVKDYTMKRATRGHPLTDEDKWRNKMISRVRILVEKPFAMIKRNFGRDRTRVTRLKRVHVQQFCNCFTYNLMNLAYLEKVKG